MEGGRSNHAVDVVDTKSYSRHACGEELASGTKDKGGEGSWRWLRFLAGLKIPSATGVQEKGVPKPVAARQMFCRSRARPFPERPGNLWWDSLWKHALQLLSCSK